MTEAEAQAMARRIGAQGYFKTSAINNQGVEELFEAAATIAWGGSLSDRGFLKKYPSDIKVSSLCRKSRRKKISRTKNSENQENNRAAT